MRNNQQGFSLLELIITIAIISLLVSLTFPTYQRYTDKARFLEVVLSVFKTKKAVELCSQIDAADASSFKQKCIGGGGGGVHDLPTPSSAVSSINVTANTAEATITVTALSNGVFNNVANPTYILLGQRKVNGQVHWREDLANASCHAAGVC